MLEKIKYFTLLNTVQCYYSNLFWANFRLGNFFPKILLEKENKDNFYYKTIEKSAKNVKMNHRFNISH